MGYVAVLYRRLGPDERLCAHRSSVTLHCGRTLMEKIRLT